MRIFRLILVESSFYGLASTDSSQMAPSSSDDCTSFSIKYSRLMGAFTFHALVQSQLTCVDLTCSPHAMTLKIYFFFFLVDFFETAVAVCVRRLYGFCALEAALRRLYGFLRTYTLVRSREPVRTKYVFCA